MSFTRSIVGCYLAFLAAIIILPAIGYPITGVDTKNLAVGTGVAAIAIAVLSPLFKK